jgi:hypothetical protein
MTDDWDGTERRATDKRFAAAMADVRDLKEGVATLADAVKVRDVEIGHGVRQVGLMLAVVLAVLVLFSLWLTGRSDDRLDDRIAHGHDTLICLLLVSPDQRTAQTLIDCQRGK